MKKLQKIVSEELGLEEGEPKELTKRKHIPHRKYRAMKEAEKQAKWEQKLEKTSKEWEQKLEKNNSEWQARKAEWEARKAEREARQAEWEKKLPEIMAARRRNEQFLNDKVDWETLKTANKAFIAWHDISTDLLGYPNPNGNLLVEQAKGSLAAIFRLFGTVSQLAIFMLTRTEARELKLKNAMDVYKVSENLQRAVNLVANDTTNDHRKIAEKIQSVFTNLPHDKRQELIELAILHAPNAEIKADIQALVEGRFSDIARTEAAQKRIENRDLRAELREYSEEIRKIKEELREMDEENRILNAAERALLKEKGSTREEYAEQEAENRKCQEELKRLKDEVKLINNDLRDQKQSPDKDAQTIREQAEKIAKLTAQIAEITAENVAKQKELEAEKAKRLITPQQLDRAEQRISELEDKIREQEFIFYGKTAEDEIEAAEFEKEIITPQTLDAFDIIAELEAEKQPEPVKPEKQREEPKIEKPEPEPKPAKDDFISIFGYERYTPEPRRRFDDYERKTYDDRPRYTEPEPIREPESRDEWQEIEDAMKKWQKADSDVEKSLMGRGLRLKIDEYEKNNSGEINGERREMMRKYRFFLSYDPVAEAEEARKNAETMQKLATMNREREQKRQQTAELETAIKYDDVKVKNVRKEDDTRQQNLKKKRMDEYEMGMS